MENILPKHLLLSFFRELINLNKLHEEHDLFFDLETNAFEFNNLNWSKEDGYIEIHGEMDRQTEQYSIEKYYFKDYLTKLINNKANKYWESFLYHLEEINIENERLFFINIQVTEIKSLINEIYKKPALKQYYTIVAEQLESMMQKIEAISLEIPHTIKMKWKKNPHFFFVIVASLVDKGFIVKPSSISYEMFYRSLFDLIEVKKMNSSKEYALDAFIQNCKSENDLFSEKRHKDKIVELRKYFVNLEAGMKKR